MKRALFLLPILALAGCGSPKSGGAASTFSWSVPSYVIDAGNEHYQCFFVKANVGGTAADPRGAVKFSYVPDTDAVHHLVVFTSDNNEVDGSTRGCAVFENGWDFRYAGGLTTNPLVMPAGVAAPLKPVQTFVFQFHYLNASTAPITDHTRVEIEYTQPGVSYTKAALAILGSTQFTIPANGTPYDVQSVCSIPTGNATTHVFGVWPHMHQIGTHFRVDFNLGGATTTPIDETWNFGDQKLWQYPGDGPAMFDVSGGDSITTTCTYTNNTGAPVSFGESSTEEMCFNFLYYYPSPTGESVTCN